MYTYDILDTQGKVRATTKGEDAKNLAIHWASLNPGWWVLENRWAIVESKQIQLEKINNG